MSGDLAAILVARRWRLPPGRDELPPPDATHGHARARLSLAALLGFGLLLAGSPAWAQIYDFNAKTGTYGWTLAGAYVDCNNPGAGCTPVPDNLTGVYWSDETNYPTAGIGADPVDGRGAIRFDTTINGDGIAGPGDYWYLHFVSPDLTALTAWQHIHGVRVRVMSNMGPGTNWVNLIVRVYDQDQQRDRYFSGPTTMTTIVKSTWNTVSFDWSAVSTFPTRYIVKNLYVNIAGSLSQNYTTGSIWIDEAQGLSDTTSPTVTISTPTSNPTYDTFGGSIALGGNAADTGGSTVNRIDWRNAATDLSGTATGTTSWSVDGIALAAGLNTITVTARDTAQNTGADEIRITLLPPAPFAKSAPANGATGVSTSPTLSWNASTGATGYGYCYDTSNDNACSTWTSAGTATSVSLGSLTPGTTYYWHVRAGGPGGTTYANGSATAFWSFTVLPLPGAFTKTAPANGATGVAPSPTLSWGPSANAASYAYCYDTTNDNACSVWTSAGTNTSVGLSGLTPGTTYYWHVRAINASGTTYANGSATAFWSFTVLPLPGAFAKASPANGATGLATNPTLSWNASAGVTGYAYCYDTTNDNACSVWTSAGTNTSVGLSGLTPGTTYYWHVRAINASGTTYANGSTTAFWGFTVRPLPGAFAKAAPANGATGLATNPTLSWNASAGATGYAYCYDTSNDNACSNWTSAGTSTSASLTSLTPGTTYYWHVRATNTVGTTYANASATAFWSFRTQPRFFTLSVAVAGTGAGVVTSDPPGIDCGSDCAESYEDGALVTLTASPAAGSTFGGWADCPQPDGARCTLSMTTARAVTAAFAKAATTQRIEAGKPSLSGNGRYLAFVSTRVDLVADDTNGHPDVFVRDTTSGQTVRASISSAGTQADGPSDEPVVSASGRYVAFLSRATNLVPGDTNGVADVFLHDRDADADGEFDEAGAIRTLRVSVASTGAQASAACAPPDLSPDGLWVVFASTASNLAPGDTNGRSDVFLHHWPSGQTLLVSTGSHGIGDGHSVAPAVSARGDVVVFASDAGNLDERDTNQVRDVFRWERATRLVVRLTGEVDGQRPQANGPSDRPDVSDDGGVAAFETLATNLTSAPDGNGAADIIVLRPRIAAGLVSDAPPASHPRVALQGVVSIVDLIRQLASAAASGNAGNGQSTSPAVSGDGSTVAFSSEATDLDPDVEDTNGQADIYVTADDDATPTCVPDDPAAPDDPSQSPAVSGDGRYVAFEQAPAPSGGDPEPESAVVVIGPPFTVTGVEQASAPLDGGTDLVLLGAGFDDQTQVAIGTRPAVSIVVESGARLTAVVPPAASPGIVDIVVTSDGQSLRLPGAFTYLPPPESQSADRDGDTLPDVWETRYGLDPDSASGPNGAEGDPDFDGLTNAQERQADSHPRAVFTRFFSEGATAPLFETEFSLVNPEDRRATVLLRFQRSDGTERAELLPVEARASRSVRVGQLPDMASREFSTVVESDVPIVADRVMTWDRPTQYGSHVETTVLAPALVWYLAEGATHSGFDLFYLLQNPNAVEAQVRVRYLRPAPLGPLQRTLTLPPTSRTNIWVDYEQFPAEADPRALANTDVSAVIEVLNAVPIIVERAMYLSNDREFFGAGHESAGVTAPATQWFLAEGSTQGHFFDMFILVANPATQDADVEVRYLLSNGTVLTKKYTVPAESRFNVWVNYEDPLLADAAVSAVVSSTTGVPIIVERAMWWPATGWYEGHNSPGTTVTGAAWAMAAGLVTETPGAAADTYVLVANTSPFDGDVSVTLLFEDGAPPSTRIFRVLANSRFTVNARLEFPEAIGRRFGVVVESLGETPAQIAVERARYSDSQGVFWAAGGNSLATRLR